VTTLARRLGTGDAVVIGLGSMIGAGAFVAVGPAAAAAGSGLLLGLLVAGVVAYCNAVASAQLAAQYPTSGGSYVYGRERLGDWWGYAAGWSFVVGKTASCAAMALTVASYVVPERGLLQRGLAVAVVVVLTAVTVRGVTRTARLTRAIVAVSVLVLLAVAVLLGSSGDADLERLVPSDVDAYGVLQSAGLLFFAFAGYARIATLGEEVRDPERSIPRAVVIALLAVLAIYLVVAASALAAVGAGSLADSSAPLRTAVTTVGAGWAAPMVTVGAALAATGSLLALLTGIGRTSLAMGRNGDLPRVLSAVHPRHRVPHRAQTAVGAVVVVVVLAFDLTGVIGFSSFGVLLYYAVANAAALTQDAGHRRYPRGLQLLGLAGCLTLAATLPVGSVLAGLVVLVVGIAGRLVVRWISRARRAAEDPDA
jgi:basic amino acid/polyamine antiporter, APA family